MQLRHSCLIVAAHEMSSTLSRATHRMQNTMAYIWNVQYGARSIRSHVGTSPNAAPATKCDTPSPNAATAAMWHCNITKWCACHEKWQYDLCLKRHLKWRTLRPSFEHELVISHPPVRRGYFSRFWGSFGMEKYEISRSGHLPKFDRMFRGPQKVTCQHLQSDTLSTITLAAVGAKSDNPTSVNAVRPTKCNTSTSPIARACHEKWRSNFTNCCVCHENGFQDYEMVRGLRYKSHEASFTMAVDSRMIRDFIRARTALSSRTRPFAGVIFRAFETHLIFSIEKYNVSRSGYLRKFHHMLTCHEKCQMLRLPQKVTITKCYAGTKSHTPMRLPRKVTLQHNNNIQFSGPATKVTLQHHQLMCVPRKVTLQHHQMWFAWIKKSH